MDHSVPHIPGIVLIRSWSLLWPSDYWFSQTTERPSPLNMHLLNFWQSIVLSLYLLLGSRIIICLAHAYHTKPATSS